MSALRYRPPLAATIITARTKALHITTRYPSCSPAADHAALSASGAIATSALEAVKNSGDTTFHSHSRVRLIFSEPYAGRASVRGFDAAVMRVESTEIPARPSLSGTLWQGASSLIRGFEDGCSYESYVIRYHPGGDDEKVVGSPGLQDSR